MLCLALLGAAQTGCQKAPTDGIKLNIGTDVIKYTAQVQVYDAAQMAALPAASNATVTVTGPDAAYVYDISGSRTLSINGGMASFAIDPARVPTAAISTIPRSTS